MAKSNNTKAKEQIKKATTQILKEELSKNYLTDNALLKSKSNTIDPTFGTGKIKAKKTGDDIEIVASDKQIVNFIKTDKERKAGERSAFAGTEKTSKKELSPFQKALGKEIASDAKRQNPFNYAAQLGEERRIKKMLDDADKIPVRELRPGETIESLPLKDRVNIAKKYAAYKAADDYIQKYVTEARKNNKYYGMSYDELQAEYDTIKSYQRAGRISDEDAWNEYTKIHFNMVPAASDEQLEEMLKNSESDMDYIISKNLSIGPNDNYEAYKQREAQLGGVIASIEKEQDDRKIFKETKAKIEEYKSKVKSIDYKYDKEGEELNYEDLFKSSALYDYVNNGDFREAYKKLLDANNQNDDYRIKGYDLLDEEEIKIFNALWKEQGAKAAEDFLKDISKILNKRAAERDANDIRDRINNSNHPVLTSMGESLKSIARNTLTAPIGAIENAGEYISGKDVDVYDATGRQAMLVEAARSTISENIARQTGGKAAPFIYNVSMSIADNIANILLFKGLGTIGAGASKLANVGSALNMSLSAASSSMLDAANRGGNDHQIFWSGVTSGAAEYIFEKISLDKLIGDAGENLIKKTDLVKYIGAQIVTEGSEEISTEIANIISDAVIMSGRGKNRLKVESYVLQGMSYEEARKKVFNENLVNIAMSGVAGSISGGVMAGGFGGINYAHTQGEIKARGNDILKDEISSIEKLIKTGLEMDKNSQAYKEAERLQKMVSEGKTPSQKDIGALALVMERQNEEEYGLENENDIATTDNAETVRGTHNILDYGIDLNKKKFRWAQHDEQQGGEDAGETRYRIEYTKENEPVAVIDKINLENVAEKDWVDVTKDAIRKFKPAIAVSGRLIKVNKKTIGEYTHSAYTKKLRKSNKTVYVDKMNAAGNLDEIILASTNYINEDLKHERKDSFKDFARGNVLMQIGENKYQASVIIGLTSKNNMVLYDVVDIKPKNFNLKKEGNLDTGQSFKKIYSDRLRLPLKDNIPQKSGTVNSNYMRNFRKNTSLPSFIENGDTVTDGLYREPSLTGIQRQLVNMGYFGRDIGAISRDLYDYANGKITRAQAERILSNPQANEIAKRIEKDEMLRNLFSQSEENTSEQARETLLTLGQKAANSKSAQELLRNEIDYFYNAGKMGIGLSAAEKSYRARNLRNNEKLAAYYRGVEAAEQFYTSNGKGKKNAYGTKGGLIANKDADALPENTRKMLALLGEKLGKRITVQSNLKDEEGRDVSGYINDTAVFINASVNDPVMYTATHEFSHRMQQLAPKEWKAYREYVISVRKGDGTYEKGMENYKLYYGEQTEGYIHDEMACDYTENLFENEKELIAFIKHNSSLATKIKEFWFKVLDKLGIREITDNARSLWEKCYKEAVKAQKSENTSVDGGVRYKIITMLDGSGRKYVQATQKVIKSKNPDMWESEIMNYVNEVVRKGEDVVIPLDNEENITITGRTAWKLSGRGKVHDNYYLIKGNAAGTIDEIISISKSVDSAPPYKEHSNGFAKYGFDYRTAYFMDVDGKYYRLKLSVGINYDGKEAYDIEGIKRTTFPSPGSKAQATTATGKSSSNTRVAQSPPSVKTYSMQDSQNNSSRSRILAVAEADRENREAAAQYAKEHAVELARENKRLREQVESMQLQIMENEGRGVSTDATKEIARKIKEVYGSKINARELQGDITKLYNKMMGAHVSGDEVNEEAREIAQKVVDGAIVIDDGMYREHQELYDRIKTTRIRVPEEDRNSFSDGFEYYRKHYTMGKLLLTNDGIELDAFWSELSHEYPHWFEEDLYGAEERLNRILEIRDVLRPRETNAFGNKAEGMVKALARDIQEAFYSVPEGKGSEKMVFYDTRSQEMKKEMDKMRKEYEKALSKAERQRDYYHQRLDKQKILPTIHRNYNYLSKMLLDPKDNRHIPQEMRGMVAEFLRLFKSEAMNSELLNEEKTLTVTATKKAALYDAYSKIINELTKDDGIIDESGNSLRIDQGLLNELKSLKEKVPIDDYGQFISLNDMNAYELNIVSRLIKGVHHAVVTQNKLFASDQKAGIRELGEKAIEEFGETIQKRGKERKSWGDKKGAVLGKALDIADSEWNYNELAPVDMFTRLGGVLETLFKNERKAFDKHDKNIKECIEKVQSIVGDTDVSGWTGKKATAETFETSAGKIKLTRAQVMSLYALMKRPQAREHILNGGIRSDDVKIKNNESLNTIDSMHVAESDIGKILETLTDKEKEIADKIVEFITRRGAQWGNETSMKLYGYEKFGEDWYFPIKVAGESIKTFYGERGEGSIRTQGMTKKLVKGAKNPIVITDFFDATINHMSGMSLYNSLALPMLDMERVLNYSRYSSEERDGIGNITNPSQFETTVRSELIKAYGKNAEAYIEKLHKDLNGQTKNNEKDGVLDNLLSNSKKVAVGANLRVLFQQPTSITRALLFLSPDNFIGAKCGKKTIKEMQEHSAIAHWKSLGFYDVEIGRSMKDIMLEKESTLDKLAYGGYGKADDMAWGIIWSAVKKEVRKNNPDIDTTSAEYFDKVTERFNYIIDRSQVVDSPFHRTQSIRNKNAFARMETAFMSEPLKTLNMYRTEMYIANRDGKIKTRLPRILTVMLTSAITLAIAQSFPDLWRGKDDEEWNEGGKQEKLANLGEAYLRLVGKNFADNINIFNQIPYVKTVSSLIQGYSASRLEYGYVEDFIFAVQGTRNEKLTAGAKFYNLARATASLFGIPIDNAVRDMKGIAETTYRFFGNNELADYNCEKIEYNIKNPENKGRFMKFYEKALANGNDEAAEMILMDYLLSTAESGSDIKKKIKDIREKGSADAFKEMLNISRETGDDSFLFDMPEQTFSINGEKIKLSDDEHNELSLSTYEILMDMAYKYINSDMYEDASAEERAEGFRVIDKYSSAAAKKQMREEYELSSWAQNIYDGYGDINDKIAQNTEEMKKEDIGRHLFEAYIKDQDKYNEVLSQYIDKGYDKEYLSSAIEKRAEQSKEYKTYYGEALKNIELTTENMTPSEIEKMSTLKEQFAGYETKKKYIPEYEGTSWAKEYNSDPVLKERSIGEHIKMLAKYDSYLASIGKKGKTPKKAEIMYFVESYTTERRMKRAIFGTLASSNMKNPY